MLALLSYVVGAGSVLALVACVALGLLRICDFIEERPRTARSIGVSLTWTVITLSTIVTLTDQLSYFFLLSSWLANYIALSTLGQQDWPNSTSSLLLSASLLSPTLAHLSLVRHFQHTSPEQDTTLQRTPWPGGRQDWDMKEPLIEHKQLYGSGEALLCFAMCWLPALWIALGVIAQNWTLPLAKGQSSATHIK